MRHEFVGRAGTAGSAGCSAFGTVFDAPLVTASGGATRLSFLVRHEFVARLGRDCDGVSTVTSNVMEGPYVDRTMSVNLEQTIVHPRNEESPFADSPFAYGEHTVLQMRAQPFEVQDELGTVVMMPIETNPRKTMLIEEDTLLRLERKMDEALRHIDKLQQRIESLDMTLARVLSR